MVVGRRVLSPPPSAQVQAAPAGRPPEFDTYLSRLVKYIPAEVAAAYLFLKGLIPPDAPRWAWWIVLGGLLLLTAWYTFWATHQPGLPRARTQIIISTVAFAVWAFAIGGPYFEAIEWYKEYYYLPGIVLALYTLAVARIPPLETK